jgi:hemerythrin-like metal-binding protein
MGTNPTSLSIIDEEHREIERAAVEMMNAIVLGSAQDSLTTASNELVRVTSKHFENEEAMLKRIHFAELAQHVRAHKKMSAKLQQLRDKIEVRETSAAFHLMREFRTMLQRHLQDEDEHYRDPLNQLAAEHGAEPLPPRIRRMGMNT